MAFFCVLNRKIGGGCYIMPAISKPVVLVQDNGLVHTSKLPLAALASRAHWLTVEWLPKYAPELNDIEGVWRDLKAHHLAHQTFAYTMSFVQAP
jgi:transposase